MEEVKWFAREWQGYRGAPALALWFNGDLNILSSNGSCCITLHGSGDNGESVVQIIDELAKASHKHVKCVLRHWTRLERIRCPCCSLSKAFAITDKLQPLLLQFEFLDLAAGRLGITLYPEHILGYWISSASCYSMQKQTVPTCPSDDSTSPEPSS